MATAGIDFTPSSLACIRVFFLHIQYDYLTGRTRDVLNHINGLLR